MSDNPRPPRRQRLTDDTTRYARLAGENIAIRRTHLGLTQEELAGRMADVGFPMSASVIFFTEKGSTGSKKNIRPRNLSVDHLMAFAEVFGCRPVDLLAQPCRTCRGVPPVGFTCNTCGAPSRADS